MLLFAALSAPDPMIESPVVFARQHECEQLAQWLDDQGVELLSDLEFIVRMSECNWFRSERNGPLCYMVYAGMQSTHSGDMRD